MSEQLPLELESAAPSAALRDAESLLALLDAWVERGWLRALDRALAGFFRELDESCPPLALLACALASHQLGHGHVCLDLAATLVSPDFALSLPPEGEDAARASLLPSEILAGVVPSQWRTALAASRLVAVDGLGEAAPLVLAGERLYLRRYWSHERAVAAAIGARLRDAPALPADLAVRLARLFPEPPVVDGERRTDWQKLACALAARGSFSLITGGPGTGKTTTVVRLLALLQGPALEAGQALRIRLAAPTGKAAARLTESIGAQVASLAVDDALRKAIPSEVTTLHRLLGSLPDSRHFRHHAGNLLPLDVLVIDEASMIDLEMMACLLDALPRHARLILLGDKDQLASVEAGALLGDLCRDAEGGFYGAETRAWLEAVGGEPLADPALREGDGERRPLAQRTVMLRHSRRFGGGSGIGRLARAVNCRDAAQARSILAESGRDLHVLRLRGEADRAFERLALDGLPARGESRPQGYAHYLKLLRESRPAADCPPDHEDWKNWAAAVLEAFDEFQLLCAVRKGPWGVEGLNPRIAAALHRRSLLDGDQGWYEGRPVLMTRNDYSLGLMNGDIGIALRLPEPPEQPGAKPQTVLRVVFPRNDGSGGLRWVLPSRLSAVETVFAMTVHKSQGSEFAHTALILPDTLNPVLTKELIYTGITRARHWFSLVESRPGVFDEAVRRQVERRSGLVEALEGRPSPPAPLP
ncbi:exodeoxyribonuclease V, alpha subunit [Azotobacter vinelandii CA]|uniref:RecBCD enzyme subunit RecD n=2 Tax=Azotobacter vinelandii TaxID=354 RepID=C1DMH0_AZOVD|nr:exodeoxyribonuclease V subunit alpha [Azotobacter vinelandii]ACO81247.1 exodeoxyribonuclease V, alpha subunit [Azotobacter vinelandii DJ]AGK13918.1 exodeoxyribonuclease V, alpha subunit [Azotobacter vinelandii CA]AGK18635.1 exodeoxyribonuclease V, alpha subunit [Azotobacter vinelandii CA6]WKN21985.1 exodeoxyribonuclease V subunit alpha [Azotobacter vinelandii]SFX27997.1 DNA helicase/exodeoxyribonuclease V, alpha subunit [Azotobacter vinelandii]